MQDAGDSRAGLEDRLRGMIIGNHSARGDTSSGITSSADAAPSYATSQGSESWQQPRAEAQASGSTQTSGHKLETIPPKGSRKRPNQAQRRQMSAQLSIPVDTRPSPQTARPYANPSAQSNRQNTYQPQQRTQRPQSATLPPPHPSQGYPNRPPTGMPFPTHARHQQSPSYPGFQPPTSSLEWRQPYGHRQQDISSTNLGGPIPSFDVPPSRGFRHHPNASSSNSRLYNPRSEDIGSQVALLERLSQDILRNAEIEPSEIMEKEAFRVRIEQICRAAIAQYERDHNGIAEFPSTSVQLKCFGSLSSGFATKASDMDLGLLSPLSKPQPESQESPIPRLVEKAFLDMGYGARLLTKTRVPIIKLCEKPPEKLRQGLLEERAKWEKGVDDDREPEDGEANDDALASPTFETRPPEESGQGHKSKPSGGVGPHAELDPEQLLGTLRQSNNVQLSSYYSMAKRVLRKLGGRDITHSTFADFGPNDFKVLNDVCHAFVRGLADKALRARLEKYKSLSFSDVQTAPSSPANRSLAGVYTQIEGELMAMAWESRQIHEKDDHLEKLAQSRLSNWKTLQDKPTYGLDPLAYNKELHFIADQLRKVPSIDLMLFQQRQYESASQYHSRAVKILLDLGGHDTTSKSSPVLPAVVSQYVSGISKEDVRTEVAEFSKSIGGNSLRAVARKHKALQLAKEFEKALQRELYRDEDVGYIEKYIHVLRGSMKKTMTGDHHFDYVVPITGQMMGLLEIIKGLPDPSQMAPNQPRDPYRDRLEFPKTGAGVQCDINFSAHLALHNTLLLRCYSHADPRVRPLVLFVKHWAKVRGINTPYRGTLSSYGYVLMMLHYLVNVAQPFVCPNLQELAPPLDPKDTPQQVDDTVMCKGRDVRFWRDEAEISRLARSGVLTLNRDSIGVLLRGFFEYYAQNGTMSTAPIRGFDWGRDVLSLRTHGGLLSKQDKGWTGAKTVFEVQNKRASTPTSASEPQLMQANPLSPTDPITEAPQTPSSDALQSPGVVTKTAHEPARGGDVKEIRHRYLFAIEDPFETDHNVARTVTHNGIVAIRDEFRRAWRIIRNAGKGTAQEDLLQAIGTEQSPRDMYSELLTEIHGRELFGDAN